MSSWTLLLLNLELSLYEITTHLIDAAQTMGNKVLIVEDSRAFSSMLKKVVEENTTFSIDVACTLEETKQLIAQHGDEYFVATVDFNLPDAPDGQAIDITLRHKIPTIVFTSSTDLSIREDLWQKGISDYASKSGVYNLDYVTWMIKRIHANHQVDVLVVDDCLLDRKRMEHLLSTQGFRVHTANSAVNAFKVLEKTENVRVAIVDCYMEEMDGLELCKKLRESKSREEMEIIGISALGDKFLSAQFIKSGANDFVNKPFLPEELLCRVNHAVDRIEHYVQLEELNQIKNQFIGIAAHDIRGPLGAVKTASDVLLKRQPTEERRNKLISLINSSSKDLLQLLETLLDISVIENGQVDIKLEEINFSELLDNRIELYEAEAIAKTIAIRTDIETNVHLLMDDIKIKQVVDNLLTNAIKYSDKDTEIKVSLKLDKESALLSVQDAGPGIPQDEQDMLFKAFTVLSTQTTGGEKKTGLGLAISKSIVDAHKGEIHYVHNDSTHSTFVLRLPIEP